MKRSIRAIFLSLAFAGLVLSFLTTPYAAIAEGNTVTDPDKFGDWVVVGPNGGDVRVIAVDPRDKDRLYISTLDGQIHTSSDAGKTWTLLANLNAPGLVLDQFLIDRRDSKILYTSGHRFTFPGGFYKSVDGGRTWKDAKELRSQAFHSMFQSEKDPNIIVLGAIGCSWVSKDSGDSWTKIEMPIASDNAVDSLAIDPRDPNVIYAGTLWRAYKTTDGGKNWRLIRDGMIDDSDVFAINIDPRNPDHIIASACSGIYESLNSGEKWRKVNGIPSQSRRTRDIVQNPGLAGPVYAATTEGFWMSSNGGSSWILTSQRDLEINSIAVHPNLPNRIFIGTNNYGVMVSNDGGKNFAPTNDNFTSRLTYSITPDSERSNRVYAITQNTVAGGGYFFFSDTGGNSWQQAKGLDINRIRPYSMLQSKLTPDNLYLGTNVGIYRSLDRGVSWTLVTAPKPVKKAPVRRRGAAAKKTAAPKKVVAAKTTTPPQPALVPVLTQKVKELTFTDDGKNGLLAGTDAGLYRTYDITKGWEKLSLGEGVNESISVVYTTDALPDTIWVGTDRSGVMLSHDGGTSWMALNATPAGIPVISIAVDTKRPDNVYVGTTQALYISRDGGKSWRMSGGNLPLGSFTSILINPDNPEEIFVSSSLENDGGIYFSENSGKKWKRLDSKEMNIPSRRVWSMAFDAHDPNKIFAGSHSSGVYRIERRTATGQAETGSDSRSRVVPAN